MIRIALIGEIGSGKTFVSKYFKYPLFNADKEVIKIYKNNKECFKKLNKKFPNNIKKFPIVKTEIKGIINKKNIKILSRIVHPYVRKELNKFLKKNKYKKHVVLDIPLLLENNLNNRSDILIYVKARRDVIIKRLKKRGKYNNKIFNILRSQQIKSKKKIQICDYIVDNNANKNNILKQIKIIIRKIR